MADWRARGTVLIACSCDWGCPCNFNARPTGGFCQGGWSWHIEEGLHAGVQLGGLAMSLFAKWPGAIHEGNGEAVAYLDERADQAQRSALTRLLRGADGGPWGIFINTYTLAGPHPARYRLESAQHKSALAIGEAVRLELTPITNPVTGAEAFPEMLLPEGLVLKRGSLAASRVFQVAGDLAFDHSGRYAAFGRFDYTGTTS